MADLPTLRGLSGGRLPTLDRPAPSAQVLPLDAALDVAGTPQSGTGQAALLTGVSAAEIHGGHFGPWTPSGLRQLVAERSVLRNVVEAGGTAAFANAYPRDWPGPRGSRSIAGPPLAAQGAGLLNRHEESLARGDAVASEIVNDGWRCHLGYAQLPDVSPVQAGANLARIAEGHDLTLYAHYSTDRAGHRGGMAGAVAALELVDAFLRGLLETLDPSVLLLIASDHGNIEDVRTGHTRNPVFGLAVGDRAPEAHDLRDLRDVAPFILNFLGTAG